MNNNFNMNMNNMSMNNMNMNNMNMNNMNMNNMNMNNMNMMVSFNNPIQLFGINMNDFIKYINYDEVNEYNKISKESIKNLDLKFDVNTEMVLKMKVHCALNIFKLSNNRIVIHIAKNNNLVTIEDELKIYSLKNFKLLSIIKSKDYTKKFVELKNKDLVIAKN